MSDEREQTDAETLWYGHPDHPGRADLPLAEQYEDVQDAIDEGAHVPATSRTLRNVQRQHRVIR